MNQAKDDTMSVKWRIEGAHTGTREFERHATRPIEMGSNSRVPVWITDLDGNAIM